MAVFANDPCPCTGCCAVPMSNACATASAGGTSACVDASPSSHASPSPSVVPATDNPKKALPTTAPVSSLFPLALALSKAALAIVVGAGQGYLLAMSGMFNPASFRSQMLFESWLLMKLFLAAMGSSMVTQALFVFPLEGGDGAESDDGGAAMSSFVNRCISVLRTCVSGILPNVLLAELQPAVVRARNSRTHGRIVLGWHRVVVGCALVGVGMTISGSGPTMMGVQLGMATLSAPWTLLGMLLGITLFYGLQRYLLLPETLSKTPEDKTLLEEILSTSTIRLTYAEVALPLGAALLLGAYGLEMAFDHHDDLQTIGLGAFRTVTPMSHIYPSMAGAYIGINQVVTRFLSGGGQGGTGAIAAIVATLTNGAAAPGEFKMDSLGKAWQFLHVYVATVIGAVLALVTMSLQLTDGDSGNAFADVTNELSFGIFSSIFGGALAAFGARYAGGCTCGHGVSGASELNIRSMFGACAIFAAGIVTAYGFRLDPKA